MKVTSPVKVPPVVGIPPPEPPPGILIVFVAPVPLAVTPLPVKFKVVAVVDNALPSSCTVTPPLPLLASANSNWPIAVAPEPLILFTFNILSAAIWLSGSIKVYSCAALWAGDWIFTPWLFSGQLSVIVPAVPPLTPWISIPVDLVASFTADAPAAAWYNLASPL